MPSSDCARAREAASARLDGELSELEAAQLDLHLAGCAACARYAAELERTTRLLRAAALVQPSAPIFMPRGRRLVSPARHAVAAAAVVAALGSAFALGDLVGFRTGSSGSTTAASKPVVSHTRPGAFALLNPPLPRTRNSRAIPV